MPDPTTEHLDETAVESILAAFYARCERDGALAVVATDYEGQVDDLVVETALDLGFGRPIGDAEDALLLAVHDLRAKLRLRFVEKTLVVRLPVIVDLEKRNDNAAPEPIIVEGIRSAIATIPFLDLDDVPVDGLPVRLAVTVEDRT